ncbi:retrovirus-related pol polyprotein from transposon TNT 1-94 [Tanacetum coccineum]
MLLFRRYGVIMRRNMFSETFHSYMLQHRILHESSCVYRPAQNGVEERKNRHLLENTKPNITKLDPKSLKCVFLGYSRIQKGYRFTTYRHQEENDDLLVYVSPTPVETTKQSAELDAPPLKVYARRPQITSYLVCEPSSQLKDAPIDEPNDALNGAPNDVSNDVPISTPNEAYGKSDAPSDAFNGSDLPLPSLAPELDLPIAVRKGKCTCRYLVSAFVSYDGLSSSSRAFVKNLDSILVPKTVGEALAHFGVTPRQGRITRHDQ